MAFYMTTVYAFVADISGLTDPFTINLLTAALTFFMVGVVLNLSLSIFSYMFR